MFENAHIPIVSCVNICIDTSFYRELVSQCVRIGQNNGKFPLKLTLDGPHISKGVHEHVLISQKMV